MSIQRLEGTEELVARLKRISAKIAGPIERKALRAGGKVYLEAAQAAAPVLKSTTPGSTALPPGALKEGLRMFSREYSGVQQVVVGPSKKTAHVAGFVETGHRNVKGTGNSASASGKDTPAHPFMRPAWESSISGVTEAIADSLRADLKGIENS